MITLLSDYGHEGPYVGVCHGVIRQILPNATIVDMGHLIEPFNVLQGAFVLADAVPYFPLGVHVAVVDPGVGTSRRAVALSCADGRSYVGPDNGLLMRAAEASGLELAVEIGRAAAGAVSDDTASATFDGRDLFAPAAARLAGGAELTEIGRRIELDSLQPLPIVAPQTDGDGLRVLAAACDRFGTLQLACGPEQLGPLGCAAELSVAGDSQPCLARQARTFADVECGELLLYVDAFGHPALAVREGSAAQRLGLAAGDWVTIRPA